MANVIDGGSLMTATIGTTRPADKRDRSFARIAGLISGVEEYLSRDWR